MLPATILSAALLCAATPPAKHTGDPAVVTLRGRAYYSMRAMAATGTASVSVEERSARYTVDIGGRRAVLSPGFSVASVDGNTVDLPYPMAFVGDDTLVPVAVLAGPVRPDTPKRETLTLGHVVIDPGHGGDDTGAIGPRGLREKDVTLSVGLELRRLLQSRGVRVTMTRTTDVFVALTARSGVANSTGADLFLSIHCNAAPSREAEGLETFALSTAVTDATRAGKAAATHKPSDLLNGALDRVNSGTERTLFRAHMDEQRRQSLKLARGLQDELVRQLGELDRGVKLRNFSVLRETYIPAALVEVGFISHRGTETKMRSATHRDRIAGALLSGLESFSREGARTASAEVRLADSSR